jgi:hypothetical protein
MRRNTLSLLRPTICALLRCVGRSFEGIAGVGIVRWVCGSIVNPRTCAYRNSHVYHHRNPIIHCGCKVDLERGRAWRILRLACKAPMRAMLYPVQAVAGKSAGRVRAQENQEVCG